MDTLKYGMEGYDVRLLQYALARAGMDPGAADGIFGRRTLRALQRFQRDRGLSADGVAGKLTWAALYPCLTGYTLHRRGPEEVESVRLDLPVITGDIPGSGRLACLMMKGLAMRYPFLAVRDVGRSVMGQPLMALSLGKGPTRVGCCAAHHADGWLAAAALLKFVEDWAEAYAVGGTVGWVPAGTLYETITLHVFPLVDPDGVDLVTGALPPEDSFYRQAQALAAYYPEAPFPDGWLGNAAGVDLDLQYPAGWAERRRVKFREGFTRPGPRGYVGSEPLIAPEVRALVRWTRDHGFDRVLSFDRGYVDWFMGTWSRPGIVIEAGTAAPTLTRFDDFYGRVQPILVRQLALSP